MRFLETRFEEYTDATSRLNMHPKLQPIFDAFPLKLVDMGNLIFYGPGGVGKYSQMLHAIKKYSPSLLKYEKKLNIVYEKKNFIFKISDIHFEINMSLLGCVSKILWYEIYQQIVNILSSRQDKTGIIVCKNFHSIHGELLEVFYSYMQENMNTSINIKFIILTESISFIPNPILNCSEIIYVKRPSKNMYVQCLKSNGSNSIIVPKLATIENIKTLNVGNPLFNGHHVIICTKIVNQLINIRTIDFVKFRDLIYDMLIYNLDISVCIWYILSTLISQKHLEHKDLSDILCRTYTFFKYYNNNYRPIYHLENYLLCLSKTIHAF